MIYKYTQTFAENLKIGEIFKPSIASHPLTIERIEYSPEISKYIINIKAFAPVLLSPKAVVYVQI